MIVNFNFTATSIVLTGYFIISIFINEKNCEYITVAIAVMHAEALLTLTAVYLRFLYSPRQIILPSSNSLLTLRHIKLRAKSKKLLIYGYHKAISS